jgi:uncharacterized membrane protein YGL010W
VSFGNALKDFGVVQEALVLALMLVTVFAVFYVDMDLSYRIAIGVMAFMVVFLATIANQILKQQREAQKKAAAQA